MKKLILFCAASALLAAAPAWATDYTNWQVGSGNWSTPANWDNGEPAQFVTANVDNAGTVTIDQSGERASGLYLGSLNPAYRGYVNMTGGSLTLDNYLFVGDQGGDTAGNHSKFTQSGGTVTTGQGLYLGACLSSSYGEYYMTGGSLTTTSSVYIGDHGTGKFVQTGGTVTVTQGTAGNFYLGRQTGSHGTYELSGTGHLISTWEENIGRDGTGVFLQNGGTHQAQNLRVRANGTYTLNNGTLLVDNLHASGTFTQTGGNVYKNPTGVGDGYIGVSGSYALQNGTVSLNKICVDGSGTLTQTGGQVSLLDALNPARTEILKGTYEISAGSADLGQVVVGYYPGEMGNLKVAGDDSSIAAYSYSQTSDGALYSIFDADGLSTIDVSNAAALAGKFYVQDPTGMAPYGVFDVLVADGGISGAFANVYLPGPDWSYGISGGDTLWVAHVPEPATILLLAFGGLVMLRKRG